jgi:hypothetical protein
MPLDDGAELFRTEPDADAFATEVRRAVVRSGATNGFGASFPAEPVFAEPATPLRSFRIASVLFQCGAPEDAYAVLVYGLSLESVDALTTEMVVESMSVAVLEGLAAVAEARGEQDVAGILEAVAGTSVPS